MRNAACHDGVGAEGMVGAQSPYSATATTQILPARRQVLPSLLVTS